MRSFYQGSHGDWKTWKMKMVIEKSWNMEFAISHGILSVMEFCHPPPSPNRTKFIIVSHHQEIKQQSRNEYFRMFSTKCHGNGNSGNGHGEVMETYFVKSVGTLFYASIELDVSFWDFVRLFFFNSKILIKYPQTTPRNTPGSAPGNYGNLAFRGCRLLKSLCPPYI